MAIDRYPSLVGFPGGEIPPSGVPAQMLGFGECGRELLNRRC